MITSKLRHKPWTIRPCAIAPRCGLAVVLFDCSRRGNESYREKQIALYQHNIELRRQHLNEAKGNFLFEPILNKGSGLYKNMTDNALFPTNFRPSPFQLSALLIAMDTGAYIVGPFRPDGSGLRYHATLVLVGDLAASDDGGSRSTSSRPDTRSAEDCTSEDTSGSDDRMEVDSNFEERHTEHQVYDCPDCDWSGKEVDRFLHLKHAHGLAQYSSPIPPTRIGQTRTNVDIDVHEGWDNPDGSTDSDSDTSSGDESVNMLLPDERESETRDTSLALHGENTSGPRSQDQSPKPFDNDEANRLKGTRAKGGNVKVSKPSDPCPVCNKVLNRKGDLKRHIDTHYPES